jgi:hypothetical protein
VTQATAIFAGDASKFPGASSREEFPIIDPGSQEAGEFKAARSRAIRRAAEAAIAYVDAPIESDQRQQLMRLASARVLGELRPETAVTVTSGEWRG